MTMAHEPRRQPKRLHRTPKTSPGWPTPSRFDDDPYPGGPRILFVGHSDSSHTHAWVDLLKGAPFNVRVFALPDGIPPDDWPVRTYVTATTTAQLDPLTRERLYAADPVRRYPKKGYARFILRGPTLEERWLARLIRDWRPHVIHTLGLDPASAFYYGVRHTFDLQSIGRWVLHIWGGADLMPTRFDADAANRASAIMSECDQLLDDNEQGFNIARRLGVHADQLATIGIVPGTGGVEVDTIRELWNGPPSSRRVIVWPKAYECPWSKSLPVLEALTLCWDRIAPCDLYMLAVQPETRMWFHSLPERIKQHCHIAERIPRNEVLSLMARARVMLAPSLVDGTPNTLLEAMAAGALPIVSPLETIRSIVCDGEHVLFARNLYPDDIARALERAMCDDALVDRAAEANQLVVRRLADREVIGPRVRDWYMQLASSSPQGSA